MQAENHKHRGAGRQNKTLEERLETQHKLLARKLAEQTLLEGDMKHDRVGKRLTRVKQSVKQAKYDISRLQWLIAQKVPPGD